MLATKPWYICITCLCLSVSVCLRVYIYIQGILPAIREVHTVVVFRGGWGTRHDMEVTPTAPGGWGGTMVAFMAPEIGDRWEDSGECAHAHRHICACMSRVIRLHACK